MRKIVVNLFLGLLISIFSTRAQSFRTVEGRPQIKSGILSVEKKKFEDSLFLMWPAHPYFRSTPPVKLDPETSYKFTVTGKDVHVTLIKIELGTNVVYDASYCEVHKTKMGLKNVPIRYGLIIERNNAVSGEEFARLEKEQFPHYREEVLGGCVVTPQSPEIASLWVCSDCKNAHADWKSTQASAQR